MLHEVKQALSRVMGMSTGVRGMSIVATKHLRDVEAAAKQYREKCQIIIGKDEMLAAKDAVILGKDKIIAEKDDALAKMDAAIHGLRQALADHLRRYHAMPNTPQIHDRIEHLGRWLKIKEAVQIAKTRVGGANDGGYICLDDFSGITAAISLGINDDVVWDKAIAERGIRVFQYDHTISALPENHPNFVFHQTKVSNVAGDGTETLNTLLSKNGLSTPLSVFGKIDIEGDEWAVLDDATVESLSTFSQLVCEFHHFERIGENSFFDMVSRVSEKLGRIFEPVHAHANNCCPLLVVGNKLFPSVLEVTFANKAKYDFVDSREVFPGPLDAPNLTDRPDHQIGRFIY